MRAANIFRNLARVDITQYLPGFEESGKQDKSMEDLGRGINV